MYKHSFDFDKFTTLMQTDPNKAFEYRDSFYKKKEKSREDIEKILTIAWIKFNKNCKMETLLKKALNNNLI